jgi:hydroxymethylbilane synthase
VLFRSAAGLKRLGLERRIRAYLSPEDSLPAAGQGAMAIEIVAAERSDGVDLAALLSPLNHEATLHAVMAERKVSKMFGASCQIPVAAHATIDPHVNGGELHLRAMVATPDGRRSAFAEVSGPAALPEALGEQVARLLEQQDAAGILAECRRDAAAAGDA